MIRFTHLNTALRTLTLLLAAGSLQQLQAAPITVVNHGFEDITGETVNGEFTFGPLNGWSGYDLSANHVIGTLAPAGTTYFTGGAPEGSRVGIAFNRQSTGGDGEYGLQQTLADTLQANTSYSLQVDIGNIASGTSSTLGFFNLDGFPGYRVDLLAGGVVIAQDNNSLAGTIAEGAFATTTVNFTTGGTHAQLGQALTIRLVNLNIVDASAPAADLEVDFDNVQLNATAVPEPGSLGLLSLGLLVTWRRRRRSQSAA